jgi:hypothetical protein
MTKRISHVGPFSLSFLTGRVEILNSPPLISSRDGNLPMLDIALKTMLLQEASEPW